MKAAFRGFFSCRSGGVTRFQPGRFATIATIITIIALTLQVGTTFASEVKSPDRPVQFNRDIRPILAETCCQCHGPDSANRQAELRLDSREDVLRERDGYSIVVPGKPEESELYLRITAADDSMQMPPADHPRQLKPNEIALLKRWIEQGAEYEKHWSFLTPACPTLPEVQHSTWPRNPIDHFVLDHLERQKLSPSPPADRATLLRRVTLDLTGLPPTPEEIEAFLADHAPDAYEKVVDRLLASPRYGERMASIWMDGARYADSGGYQGDIPRTMWPWRDWVVRAYNSNMPFDQFTIEQLAGDLLPNPTADQLIATGFNRNHRVNDEDGIILEEFRTEYVADRVDTTASVWLGLTVGCARCHDHKFDPITQKDYYSFFAYFNSVAEAGRGHGNSQPLYFFDPSIRPEIEAIDKRLLELKDPAQGEYNEVTEFKEKRSTILASSLTTMIMQDLPKPRETHILIRGQYSEPGDVATPATPSALPEASGETPPNRLGLARWIIDPQNPLTARVAVNRYWQMYFGTGLVATPEDFGTRGEAPSHPELLDWLAVEFPRSGWDVKAMQRLIVTSATYRQSSTTDKPSYERDPANRLLARGARFRLPAEMVRDQALAAAGLLCEEVAGPPVKPYQPTGLWAELVSFAPEYERSVNGDLYRRSLYTYMRRTVPPPAMTAFDLPSREICAVRRGRTNTPLQALVVMNDPTFVEAARVLADRSIRESGGDPGSAIDVAFRRVLARFPTPEERALLLEEFQRRADSFSSDPELAKQFLNIGETLAAEDLEPTALAAFTAVTSLILNLDEAITKE
ncbi:MAG: PSD1 and planctomycete cytochrome C domain-containing protein [Planctomycetota bacterium]|nr:DUF1553 domain-containing protein [Planctomycetaceae bacterium]MDQ3329412.1 PSD1 and planctomycete cytochrome C domain-containing protein [Planctomycetota bacterium]